MKHNILSILTMGALAMASCTTDSPETTVSEFTTQPESMDAWVGGINSTMALAVGSYAELLDVATDNYYNAYSRSNREFDKPNILYTDNDVESLQRYVGKLREMSNFALNTLAGTQKPTTQQLTDIYTAKAYSYILAGENFTGLPADNGTYPVDAEAQLNLALKVLDEGREAIADDAFLPVYHTLTARIYRDLGNKDLAREHAEAALRADADFVATVKFDEANGVVSNIKDRSFSPNWWEPLPRLDFLDPKYNDLAGYANDQAIAYAKAEEDYLILAEVAVATSDAALTEYKQTYLPQLFSLIASRAKTTLTDSLEMREYQQGGVKANLNTSQWLVKASADDPALAGLVLDRAKNAIVVPAVSGTSLSLEQMEQASGTDFLELLYLMRQEVFFAEGRRFADLGMRLPLCEVEAVKLQQRYPDESVSAFTQAYIPSWLPQGDYALDAFTFDVATRTITITHNINRLLVRSGQTAFAK